MEIVLPTYTMEKLNEFASQQWGKARSFLRKTYSLTEDESKDVFQEAFITLFTQIKDGSFVEREAKMSTYFTRICMNKAHEYLRQKGKAVSPQDELSLSILSGEILSEQIDSLIGLEADSSNIQSQKEALVEQIIRKLDEPCDKLLWGFYWDNLSLGTLAEMLGYKGANSIKVIKHRCVEKFRNRFESLSQDLFK